MRLVPGGERQDLTCGWYPFSFGLKILYRMFRNLGLLLQRWIKARSTVAMFGGALIAERILQALSTRMDSPNPALRQRHLNQICR